MESLPDSQVFYRWSPIKPLPDELFLYNSSINVARWQQVLTSPENIMKLQRLWSVETGMIERLYSFDEKVLICISCRP